jgi:hypothetical protein
MVAKMKLNDRSVLRRVRRKLLFAHYRTENAGNIFEINYTLIYRGFDIVDDVEDIMFDIRWGLIEGVRH